MGNTKKEEVELSSPPHEPVMWRVIMPKEGCVCFVKIRTWFDARAQGSMKLGCSPDQIKVEQLGECGREGGK